MKKRASRSLRSRRQLGNCATRDRRWKRASSRWKKLLSNQPLLELHNQIEALRLDLNKLQGQIEVLVNENELTQKRQKDFYIDLDSRLRRIEQPGESAASDPLLPLQSTSRR